MSFPTAVKLLSAGTNPESSLWKAMQIDTPQGFSALKAMAHAIDEKVHPLPLVKEVLKTFDSHNSALREEPRGEGWCVDFDPNSVVGKEISRLMTDVCREMLKKNFGLHWGFFNCCKPTGSPQENDTKATPEDQVLWQNNIDC